MDGQIKDFNSTSNFFARKASIGVMSTFFIYENVNRGIFIANHVPFCFEVRTLASGGSRIFLEGATTPNVGVLTYYFANFLLKSA